VRLPELHAEQASSELGRGLVLLDFFQATCPPCRALEPRLEAFAGRHRDALTVFRVDLDHNAETPRDFAVMSLPTLVLLRDGQEIARLDGLIRDEDLEALLERSGSAP